MNHIVLSGPQKPPAGGAKPRSLIILLHGLGSNGQDLISLAPFFAASLPDAHFISPNAGFPCDMAPMGYQWFSLRDWSVPSMQKGAHDALPALNAFLNAELERFDLTDDRLALVGFSQGTMMALYAGLRRPKACAGIVGFSGAMIGEEDIVSKPPICLIHGQQDTVVPFGAMALAASSLKAHGIPCEQHARPYLAHSIDPEGIQIAAAFLKAKLA